MPLPTTPLDAVTRAVDRTLGLAAHPQRVAVAVSGGSDSVALLGAVAALAQRPGGPAEVVAVHVHHGPRTGADEDASHVRALAARLGTGFRLRHAPPIGNGIGNGTGNGSSETAARRRRYRALAQAAASLGTSVVLLAHHDDDVHETLVLRLERGHDGPRALAGIPFCRPLSPGIVLLRPFVVGPRPPGRGDLAADREARGLAAREDPTNRDTAIPRNRVRRFLDGPGLGQRARLRAIAAHHRQRLGDLVRQAADLLATGLSIEGSGAALALPLGRPLPDPETWSEVLHLLGGCLASPRRIDPRGAVVRQCCRQLATGSGQLSLPASPSPLIARFTERRMHLPGEALVPGDPMARVMAAVLKAPIFI